LGTNFNIPFSESTKSEIDEKEKEDSVKIDVDDNDFIKWDLTAVGVYVGLNPIRIDTLNNLTIGINALCINIVHSITKGFYDDFCTFNLAYIRVFIGKSWWI